MLITCASRDDLVYTRIRYLPRFTQARIRQGVPTLCASSSPEPPDTDQPGPPAQNGESDLAGLTDPTHLSKGVEWCAGSGEPSWHSGQCLCPRHPPFKGFRMRWAQGQTCGHHGSRQPLVQALKWQHSLPWAEAPSSTEYWGEGLQEEKRNSTGS